MNDYNIISYSISRRFLWSLNDNFPKPGKITILTENFLEDSKIARTYSSAFKFDIKTIVENQEGATLGELATLDTSTNLLVVDGRCFLPKGIFEAISKSNSPVYCSAYKLKEPYASRAGVYGTEIKESWLSTDKGDLLDGNFMWWIPGERNINDLNRSYGNNIITWNDGGWPEKRYKIDGSP